MTTTENGPAAGSRRSGRRRGMPSPTSPDGTTACGAAAGAPMSTRHRSIGTHAGRQPGGQAAARRTGPRPRCAGVRRRRRGRWCQFGTVEELPNIHHGKEWEQGLVRRPDFRITCLFVDRRYRRKGVAATAVIGALELIGIAGGGLVEAYPTISRRGRRRRRRFSTTPPGRCTNSSGSPTSVRRDRAKRSWTSRSRSPRPRSRFVLIAIRSVVDGLDETIETGQMRGRTSHHRCMQQGRWMRTVEKPSTNLACGQSRAAPRAGTNWVTKSCHIGSEPFPAQSRGGPSATAGSLLESGRAHAG